MKRVWSKLLNDFILRRKKSSIPVVYINIVQQDRDILKLILNQSINEMKAKYCNNRQSNKMGLPTPLSFSAVFQGVLKKMDG